MPDNAGEAAAWWRGALRLAVLGAGLSPRDFWSLSLPEFLALTSVTASPQDITGRNELEALMNAFPDTKDAGHGAAR